MGAAPSLPWAPAWERPPLAPEARDCPGVCVCVGGACQQGGEGPAGWRKYLREAGRVRAAASGDAGEEGWVPAGQDVLVSPAPGCGRVVSDPAEPLGLAGVGSRCVCVACRPPGPAGFRWVKVALGTPHGPEGRAGQAGQLSDQQPAPGIGGPQTAAQLGRPHGVGVAGSQQVVASGSLGMPRAVCARCPVRPQCLSHARWRAAWGAEGPGPSRCSLPESWPPELTPRRGPAGQEGGGRERRGAQRR